MITNKQILTEKQWKLVHDKYHKLMITISKNMSGDPVICDTPEVISDLQVVTLEAVETFSRLNNREFDEFFNSPEFDKYIKTCYWNYKNKTGKGVTNKKAIRQNTIQISGGWRGDSDSEAVLEIPASEMSEYSAEMFLEDMNRELSEYQKYLIELITNTPDCIKPSGKVNRLMLGNLENKRWSDIDKELKSISKITGVDL